MTIAMTQQTDLTLERWIQAVKACGRDEAARIEAAVKAAGRRQRASDDVVADALPHVFAAVVINGVSLESAANEAVLSLMRRAATRAADEVSIEASEDEGYALPLQDDEGYNVNPWHAASSVQGYARGINGGSHGGELLPLQAALDVAPVGAAAVVQAVITDAMVKVVDTHTLPSGVQGPICKCGSTKTVFRPAARTLSKALYLPLKVGIVASAAGVARPHSKDESMALVRAACRAFGIVEALRSGALPGSLAYVHSEHLRKTAVLILAARRYVTGERRAYRGNGQAIWQNDARPSGISPASYAALSPFTPDLHTYRTLHSLPQGVQGPQGIRILQAALGAYEAVKGVQVNVRTGSHGYSLGASSPAVGRNLDGSPTDIYQASAKVTAGKASARQAADDVARAAAESRDVGSVCSRYDVSPEGVTCHCGSAIGQPLTLATIKAKVRIRATGPTPPTASWFALVHTLIVCPRTYVGRDGQTRCNCGSKRGVLTVKGEHRARSAAAMAVSRYSL